MAQCPPTREASAPSTALEKLTLTERPSSTPASKVYSDMAVSHAPLMTPPDSTRANFGPRIVGRSITQSEPKNDKIFITSQADDDVFAVKKSSPSQDHYEICSAPSPNEKPAPRPDRLSAPITAINAQGVLPPEACVFVANLSVVRSDEQLEEACHSAFDQFGECVVKVRRDRHKHPFALIQFHNVEDANQAVENGHELVVDGRKIRTEHAQARRSVVLSRISGGPVTQEEARDLLERYGPISHMQLTTHQDARLHGLPEGMWVQFAYYLDYKDAVKGFNHTTALYKIYDPPALEPRVRSVPGGPHIYQGLRTPRSTTDQKSIFVGNLPDDVQEDEIRGIFQRYGDIKGVNIIRKPISGGSGYNIFGFVEFSNAQEADTAAQAEIDIHGHRIRVEPKEYSARRHTRLQSYPASIPILDKRHGRMIGWPSSANQYYPASGYFVQTPQQYCFGHADMTMYHDGNIGWVAPHNYDGRQYQHCEHQQHVPYQQAYQHGGSHPWSGYATRSHRGNLSSVHGADPGQRSYSR